MKAVITGGAGFIGSHLTDLLLKNKISVTLKDIKGEEILSVEI